MRGKKLEVSASEMMEMRRQGLSNADIAAVLDISVPTVFKYIGKQGRRMERLAVFADKGKKKEGDEEEIRETKKTNDEAEVCAVRGDICCRIGAGRGEQYCQISYDQERRRFCYAVL